MSVLVVGSVNADLTVRAGHIPRPGETVLGEGAQLSPGGKGANQAVASALAGAATTLIGAVGTDPFREVALRGLVRAGVNLGGLRFLEGATGLALITVDDRGENAITVASGANARLGVADLPAGGSAWRTYTHLLLQQELSPEVTLEAAGRARAAGVPVLLNAAPTRPPTPGLLAATTHLLVNEHELGALAGADQTPEAAARALLAPPGQPGPQAVTVTLGALGSLTVTPAGTYRLPAAPARVVDTTGAGDTFCGVLAARLSLGEDLPAALHWAGVAAALTCERPGAQDAMPDWAAVQAAAPAARMG